MRVIARAHASTCATSLMHVKNRALHSVYKTNCLGHCNEENERKIKNIKLKSCHFALNFGNVLLA